MTEPARCPTRGTGTRLRPGQMALMGPLSPCPRHRRSPVTGRRTRQNVATRSPVRRSTRGAWRRGYMKGGGVGQGIFWGGSLLPLENRHAARPPTINHCHIGRCFQLAGNPIEIRSPSGWVSICAAKSERQVESGATVLTTCAIRQAPL